MDFLWTIFKWSFLRFFPTSNAYELPTDDTPRGASFCASAIAVTVKRQGKKWLLPVNLTLFLLGALFLIVDDYIQVHTLSSAIHVVAIAAASVFFVLKFDAWKLKHDQNLLKLTYIVFASFLGGFVCITYFFLIVYENIAAYAFWRGN